MRTYKNSYTPHGKILSLCLLFLISLVTINSAFSADLNGTVETADGTPITALVLASGRSVFSNTPRGVFSLRGLPLAPDGSINLQVYAAGFYPFFKNITNFKAQSVVMEPAKVCDVGGPLTDKQKTELLIGDWQFTFTIINTFDPIYTLFGPAYFGETSESWLVNGTDDFYNPDVIALWDTGIDEYILIDVLNSNPDDYLSFVFQLIDDDNVSGDMYTSINGDFQYASSFQGRRTTIGGSATALKRSPSVSGSMDFEARLMEERELIYSAKAALNRSSSESTEEASKRAAREAAVGRLREARQAR